MTPAVIFAAAVRALALCAVLSGLAAVLAYTSFSLSDHARVAQAMRDADPVVLGAREGGRFAVNYFPECVAVALLLREASRSDAAAPFRAEAILPPEGERICDTVRRALNGEADMPWFTYARYWHGYLTVHRAVLSHAGYETLRWGTGLAAMLSTLVFFVAFLRRVGPTAAICAALPVLALLDWSSLMLLPTHAIALSALFGAAAWFASGAAQRTPQGQLIAAAMAGAIYQFFDFLYHPALLALLVSFTAAAAVEERQRLAVGFWCFAAALGGYGALWSGKWVLALGLMAQGETIFLFTGGDFGRWAAGAIWPGEATAQLTAFAFGAQPFTALAMILAGIAIVVMRRPDPRAFAVRALPCLLAVIVLEVKSAHTLAHIEFTFRDIVFIAALTLAALAHAAQTAPAFRRAAISAGA